MPAANPTQGLFAEHRFPQGLKYQAGFVGPEEEEESLLRQVERLPFEKFEFHGFTGKRRTVSSAGAMISTAVALTKTEDMPEFAGVRARDEAFAGIAQGDFQQVLVTEYGAGAGIGWHKNRSVFGDVLGISLLSSCIFRLRRKTGKSWERRKLIAGPRSVYLLHGPSRTEWEHSIPAVLKLRYSITFRNVLERAS